MLILLSFTFKSSTWEQVKPIFAFSERSNKQKTIRAEQTGTNTSIENQFNKQKLIKIRIGSDVT